MLGIARNRNHPLSWLLKRFLNDSLRRVFESKRKESRKGKFLSSRVLSLLPLFPLKLFSNQSEVPGRRTRRQRSHPIIRIVIPLPPLFPRSTVGERFSNGYLFISFVNTMSKIAVSRPGKIARWISRPIKHEFWQQFPVIDICSASRPPITQ